MLSDASDDPFGMGWTKWLYETPFSNVCPEENTIARFNPESHVATTRG
jgi:hypothetical protein